MVVVFLDMWIYLLHRGGRMFRHAYHLLHHRGSLFRHVYCVSSIAQFKDGGRIFSCIAKRHDQALFVAYHEETSPVLYFNQCCGAGAGAEAARSRIFWSEPEPFRDAAPAPTMVLNMFWN
jgi:hypothetical protein